MTKDRILYEDPHLLVCHKPAGIAAQTARVGQADMVSEILNYLASQGKTPGQSPFLGVVHRLDQPVEGILVFAKTKAAAAALSAQAAGEGMEKEYLALVHRKGGAQTGDTAGKEASALTREKSMPQAGTLTDYLLKDGKTNLSKVAPEGTKGAKRAVLEYRVLESGEVREILRGVKRAEEPENGAPVKEAVPDETERKEILTDIVNFDAPLALLRIRLHTGRHHQIRVQLAHAGMPILGDCKYADEETAALAKKLGIRETALCAFRLSFDHPQTGKRMAFQIAPEGAVLRGVYRISAQGENSISAGRL